MRHLIAQGLKRRGLIRTLTGFVPSNNLSTGLMATRARSAPSIGHGVGHRRLDKSELLSRELDLEGEGIKQQFNKMKLGFNKMKSDVKKSMKPLKFRM